MFVPAYALGVLVIGIVLIAATWKALDVLRGAGPTYSLAATKRCLEAPDRVVHHRPAQKRGWPRLEVAVRHSTDPHNVQILVFAPTPRDAKSAEWSDSEKRHRRGNVLLLTYGAGFAPPDREIRACLQEAP